MFGRPAGFAIVSYTVHLFFSGTVFEPDVIGRKNVRREQRDANSGPHIVMQIPVC